MKSKQSGFMAWGGMIFLLFFVIVFAVLLVWRLGSDDDSESVDTSTTTQEVNESASELPEATSGEATETSAPADGEEPAPTEEITLEAKNDYVATGTATRTTEGTYLHTVIPYSLYFPSFISLCSIFGKIREVINQDV